MKLCKTLELQELMRFWVDEAATCWDGSAHSSKGTEALHLGPFRTPYVPLHLAVHHSLYCIFFMIKNLSFIFSFLSAPRGLWDLSSVTKPGPQK